MQVDDEESDAGFDFEHDEGERGWASARGDGGRRVRVFPPRALRLRALVGWWRWPRRKRLKHPTALTARGAWQALVVDGGTVGEPVKHGDSIYLRACGGAHLMASPMRKDRLVVALWADPGEWQAVQVLRCSDAAGAYGHAESDAANDNGVDAPAEEPPAVEPPAVEPPAVEPPAVRRASSRSTRGALEQRLEERIVKKRRTK